MHTARISRPTPAACALFRGLLVEPLVTRSALLHARPSYVVVEIGPSDRGEVSRVWKRANKFRATRIRYVGLDPFFELNPDALQERFQRTARTGVEVELHPHALPERLPFPDSSVHELHAHAVLIKQRERDGALRYRYFRPVPRSVGERFLRQARRVLVRGGRLFVSGNEVHDFYPLLWQTARWFRSCGFSIEQRGGMEEAAIFSEYGPHHLIRLRKI